jgi:hypothetical protein
MATLSAQMTALRQKRRADAEHAVHLDPDPHVTDNALTGLKSGPDDLRHGSTGLPGSASIAAISCEVISE